MVVIEGKVVYMSLVQISEHLVLINYIWVILSAGLGTNIITWVWKYGIPPSKPFERRECECFTDHTLAHPLNCRGGVVARLSA